MADHLTISTATETREQAVALAQSAVQARLAAGAQIIGPVASVFWHDGECGTGEEYQLLLTTSTARYAQLEALLVEQHPWTNPEVRATPIVTGAATYLDWVDRSTAD
ncbi:divalent-cation tolerance protein CutA [Streptomyces sp. NPDC058459]|uniref:divalent-cation tolerance protein CutA n=1 Tax=Streptomyces sp. NPDC058459 TaxID=3346508 RepID=UPI00364CF55B